MVQVPEPSAVTTPEPNPTLAIVAQAKLHVPPVVACDNVFVWPTHNGVLPMIGDGVGVTVITAVSVQPALTAYVTIQVPVEDPPVTTPVLGLTVNVAGHADDQVPPGDAVDSVIVDPEQTDVGPVIGGAADTTVTTSWAAQPPTVYLIVVVPGVDPITIPVKAPTEATVTGVLVHTPPAVVLVSVMVAPTQTLDGPLMAEGNGFTVIILVE